MLFRIELLASTIISWWTLVPRCKIGKSSSITGYVVKVILIFNQLSLLLFNQTLGVHHVITN